MRALWTSVACFAAITMMCILARVRLPSALSTSKAGAEVALGYMADWAKWMSGIQTASLGGLLLLAFHDGKSLALTWDPIVAGIAITATCLAGWALLCGAFVLCAVPSLALRIHAIPGERASEEFDIYAQPLYRYLDGKHRSIRITVGYMMILQHWSWAVSLLLLGGVFVYAAVHR